MSEAGPSTRPCTPPPRPVPGSDLQLTPEQVKRIEMNRLRGTFTSHLLSQKVIDLTREPIIIAKAQQRQKETASSSSSLPNLNNKRPLAVVPATSTSPTGPSRQQQQKLKRDTRLGKYFDYDLSKMVNSKGGFLVEDDKEVDEVHKAKEKERERQRAVQNLDPRTCYPFYPVARRKKSRESEINHFELTIC